MSSETDQPSCGADDLGRPIPPRAHAVSVCLPTWADNVGYERAEPRVVDRMQCGYPRFFLHPSVVRLIQACDARFARPGERCLTFPSLRVAQRAAEYVRTRDGLAARIDPWGAGGVHSVCVPAAAWDHLKAYWQHSGQIVCSRLAERTLSGRGDPADGASARQAIRRRMAGLVGCDPVDVWLYPSGMAAMETAFRACRRLRPSAKSVQFGFPYVDSLKVQERFGSGVRFLPRGDADDLRILAATAAGEPIMALFCEFPGNPLLGCPDLKRIDELAQAGDFPVVVDDTIGALVNVDVLPAADIVTCSLTKFFSGAGDAMGGSLVLNRRRPGARRLREALEAEFEELLDGEEADTLERNSRDCVERVRRINRTAEQLCDTLRDHPAVERIDYPKYRTSELYRAFLRAGGGYGGLFSILLREPEKNAPRFFDALRIAKGPNLGTNFSLCCPYTILAHYNELDFVESCGISRHLVRVSVGLEDAQWLATRFLEALACVTA